MGKIDISTRSAPAAVGPYSQAIKVGNFLFCSGQIPLDPQSGIIVGEDIKTQTEQVLKNLEAILKAERLGFSSVVKTTVFLTDISEFAEMNEVYGKYFMSPYPARSTVQVSALPRGAKVEIELIAYF
ncbi:MAG TPA: RidA family protein [Verrucomicrobiota bacterium]|mgnify:CR=1 FL=1|nr:RidA family protein [Verrucomicrobiota bacterium]